jgi:hypothetical protein
MKTQLLGLSVFILVLINGTDGYGQTPADIQKAKNSVKSYLLKQLNDPDSYRSASWGKLKKTFSDFYDTDTRKLISDSIDMYRRSKDEIRTNLNTFYTIPNYAKDPKYKSLVDLNNEVDSAITSLENLMVSKEKSFKGKFDGYIIDHSFRARNKFNALVLQSWFFILNKSFKVTAADDNEEAELRRRELQDKLDALHN